jgi:hypothetical protein
MYKDENIKDSLLTNENLLDWKDVNLKIDGHLNHFQITLKD